MNARAKSVEVEGNAAAVLVLPADLRIADLGAVQSNLKSLFASVEVALDASGVERVDTAALQLLVAFRREAKARGMAPAWRNVSTVLREAASLLGLTNALELPALPA